MEVNVSLTTQCTKISIIKIPAVPVDMVNDNTVFVATNLTLDFSIGLFVECSIVPDQVSPCSFAVIFKLMIVPTPLSSARAHSWVLDLPRGNVR